MPKPINMVGKRFGKLVVIEQAKSENGRAMWKCRCDCGNVCITRGSRLRAGQVKSCGCYLKQVGERSKTHGLSHSKIYRTWTNMKTRCYNKKSENYPDYGGRGISVCSEWAGRNGFVNFYNWAIKSGYKEGLSIDRKNVNGNYEPSNCRWETMALQQGNKTTNHFVEFNGEKHTVSEWARIFGTERTTVRSRLALGWTMEQIAAAPYKGAKRKAAS